MSVDNPSLEDFSPYLGEAFEVDLDGSPLCLKLALAQALPWSMRDAGAFRIEFRGPAQPVLPQAIYPLARDGETYHIFIVPVEQSGEGVAYEAIFN